MPVNWRVTLGVELGGGSFLETPCPAPQLREDSERKPGIQRDVSPPKEEQPGLLHQMALINQECSRLKG